MDRQPLYDDLGNRVGWITDEGGYLFDVHIDYSFEQQLEMISYGADINYLVTVNIKIKELERLLQGCRNPYYRRTLEADLTSLRAIKRLLEMEE